MYYPISYLSPARDTNQRRDIMANIDKAVSDWDDNYFGRKGQPDIINFLAEKYGENSYNVQEVKSILLIHAAAVSGIESFSFSL